MTREEAIAKVKGYLTDLLPSEEYDEVEEIIKALEQESKTEWIPVSERLPGEMDSYMTTVDYGEYGLAVGQRYYYGKGLGWGKEDCVIAWMPLPEPYKAESEE